ncbi:MAG TPA: ornithine cyclodeaminase family protein [Pyrinomonadaceae bacterium]|nr:ornithine cyclodeaminase family protein [Pyrinomonadaceae bacterium]
MKPPDTLLLSRSDVAALLSLEECIPAVEEAFRLHAEGKSLPPGVLGVHARDGGFHIKAAGLDLSRPYFAAKVNANFFRNAERFGLPTIQGVVVLYDGENGRPLAVMDSMEVTTLRTGAATAVAAKYLARADSKVATVCGCGNQGRVQLRALAQVLPLERAYAYDRDESHARAFADELSGELRIEVEAAVDLADAVRRSDVCVTCTPSKKFFLSREDVSAGTFVAGVGADNEDKQELDPRLFASNKVVVDILDQCAAIGDLHHAIEARVVSRADAHAELGEIVAGRKAGRTSPEEITIFDSTGTALQDVAAAAIVYEKAVASDRVSRFAFAG